MDTIKLTLIVIAFWLQLIPLGNAHTATVKKTSMDIPWTKRQLKLGKKKHRQQTEQDIKCLLCLRHGFFSLPVESQFDRWCGVCSRSSFVNVDAKLHHATMQQAVRVVVCTLAILVLFDLLLFPFSPQCFVQCDKLEKLAFKFIKKALKKKYKYKSIKIVAVPVPIVVKKQEAGGGGGGG